jgi:molybdenum cofactor biosynthesis protein B
MSTSTQQHRQQAPASVRCVVVTVSDTRTMETDTGGSLVGKLLREAGHMLVSRHIIRDEPAEMRPLIESSSASGEVDAILLTGGTGISSRDHTYETVSQLFTKTLPGYGELFRMLSFAEIGPAAMLSRATAGVVGRTLVITMPGSPHGVELAMRQLIVPELSHLVREAQR